MNRIQLSPDCAAARLQASAWLDGELREVAALLAHLERCEACKTHAAELRATHALFTPLRESEPVADLWPAIAARAQGAQLRPVASARSRMLRLAAACLGFAGTAALLHATSAARGEQPSRSVAGQLRLPPALHDATDHAQGLRDLPEQRLLASIDPSPLESR